jgi:hypothetical protein
MLKLTPPATPVPKLAPAPEGGPFTDAWRTLHATRDMFLATLRDLHKWDDDRAREAVACLMTELRKLRLIE